MKKRFGVWLAVSVMGFGLSLRAQNDGDHCITDGSGRTYLDVDAQVGGGTQGPINMTIGLNPLGNATLRVRGDELLQFDEFDGSYYCTLRSDVQNETNQNWSMVRGELEIGRLWNTALGNSFNIGTRRDNGPMWVRNAATDGIRLAYNDDFTMNGYPLRVVGYAQLGEHVAIDGLNPLSRLTLVHENQGADDPALEYRPWMRNGLSGTGNSDMFYLGQKNATWVEGEDIETDDNNDVVAAWGDDALPEGTDHRFDSFQFRYIDGNDEGSAGDVDGLELLRLRPYRLNEEDPVIGYVGIGDWNSTGELPDESLDIKEGTIRIRKLVDDYNANYTKVVVTDDDGRLHWTDAISPSGSDCDWTVENAGTSGSSTAHDVYTAVGSSNSCPDAKDAVGIGIGQPEYKLDIAHSDTDVDRPGGVRVDVETDASGWHYGVTSSVYPATGGTVLTNAASVSAKVDNVGTASAGTADSYGVFARSNTDEDLFVRKSIGVYGDAVASDGTPTSLWGAEFSARGTGATATEGIGVYAHVTNSTGTMGTGYGVFAECSGATNNWAGWFQGNAKVTGTLTVATTVYTSDAMLKENVVDLVPSEAGEALMELRPVSYDFDQAQFGYLDLPQGPQVGLIAQEVETVLPGLVHASVQPATRDDEGNVLHEELSIKGINYVGLVPYLVAAFQEQNARIAALESDLASCCSQERSARPSSTAGSELETDLRIIPNPVADRTELRYTVAAEGTVRLEITDASGRSLQVQDEGTRSAGTFSYGWDTTSLAAGTYFCTLYVNDEPLVKKAVKLNQR